MNQDYAVGIGFPVIFALILSVSALADQPPDEATPSEQLNEAETPTPDEVRFEGRTIKEWLSDWDPNNFESDQRAIRALVAIGQPAVDPLANLITRRHRHSGQAINTLAKMGDKARDAMVALLELAADKHAANPEGWTWNVSLRALLFSEVHNMAWAADQWVPVLGEVAADTSEPEMIRTRAIYSLGGMGPAATPTLTSLASNADRAVRQAANDALADAAVAAGRAKEEVYEEIIARNPTDPNVPHYLTRMKERFNAGRIHPPTQNVKAALRESLAAKPDAETAWALATIIRNGLANTDLTFASPPGGGSTKWDREDPAESYSTLAGAIEICLNAALPDSDLAGRAGRSLARLRLLQGDWDGMNAALQRIGQAPVPESVRATLSAPPADWSQLARDWHPADQSLRDGNCAIEFQFEKEGRPLAGAHVLVRRPPDPNLNRFTGIRVDTLLHATQPLETKPYDPFGYMATDRSATRYAVSDAQGRVRIEGLPKVPVVVEVLIPTSNFAEPGISWDLVMEVAPNDIRPTEFGNKDSVRRDQPPAVVELAENETIHYPKLIVRPQLALNVAPWSPVDADDFVLEWRSLQETNPSVDRYEVEMTLVAPAQSPDFLASQRAIRTTTEEALDARGTVGSTGVGGQRLRPGNIYLFEVRAIDRDGTVVARLPRTPVWVPWPDRDSLSPVHEGGAISDVPIFDEVWWQGATIHGDGTRTELREAVAKYLSSSADSFEYEYVGLGEAWLNCLDGKVDVGRHALEQFVRDLPEGNVVRGTARSLIKMLDEGKALPKRLEFAADE
jgi:hypothetical protein